MLEMLEQGQSVKLLPEVVSQKDGSMSTARGPYGSPWPILGVPILRL